MRRAQSIAFVPLQAAIALRTSGLPVALALLMALLTANPAWAQSWRTEPLSVLDQRYMAQQRDRVDALARRHLGEQLNGDADDLETLQELLDRGLVQATDTETLQAMGVVLGDQLERDLDLNWVVYVDNLGRSRALEIPAIKKEFLFPVTMISRRVEAGAEADVAALYDKAQRIVEQVRQRTSPF